MLLCDYASIPLCLCTSMPIYLYTFIPLCLFTSMLLYFHISSPLYLYARIPLNFYTSILLHFYASIGRASRFWLPEPHSEGQVDQIHVLFYSLPFEPALTMVTNRLSLLRLFLPILPA